MSAGRRLTGTGPSGVLYRAFKFELKNLRAEQVELLHRSAGAARFCYNTLLALCAEDYAEYLEELDSRQCWGEARSRAEARALTQAPLSLRGQFALNYELKALKQAHPFLKDCHSQVLQQKLADLHQAYENFFAGRSGRPQFKKKGGSDSIRYPQGFKLEEGNSRLYLPKIGWVSYRNSRRIEGKPKHVSLSHRAGKWYVSVLCEQPAPTPLSPVRAERITVVIPGRNCFACSLEGEHFCLPETTLRKLEGRLQVLRLRLHHKHPHSRRTERLKQQIARVQRRIADLRLNVLHQISTALLKNHELCVVPGSGRQAEAGGWSFGGSGETTDLRGAVQGRAESGGNQNQEGKTQVSLWGLFCSFLEYKAQARGGTLWRVSWQDPDALLEQGTLNGFEGRDNTGLIRAGLARIAHERGIEIPGLSNQEVNHPGGQQCEPAAAEEGH